MRSFQRLPLILFAFLALLMTPATWGQESSAFFDTPRVLLDDDSPPFNRLFDFNGDGVQDAVGHRVNSNGTDMEVVVWFNDGEGRFSPIFTQNGLPFSGPNGTPMNLEVGHLNNDDFEDFVIAGEYGTLVYLSNGNGTFTRSAFDEWPNEIFSLAVADFDGDGIDDIALSVVTSADEPGLRIRWSNGSVVTYVLSFPWAALQLTVTEADGDSDPDLALWIVNYFDIGVGLVSFDGMSLIEGPVFNSAVTGWSGKYVAGDIDGDQDDDIVGFLINSSGQPKVEVLRRTGPSSWQLESPENGGPAEFLADIDADGDLDGVCCGGGGGGGGGSDPTWPTLDFESTFQIAINDGTGVFDDAFEFGGRGSQQLAGVADVDGDGDQDMVAGACVYYASEPLAQDPTPPAFANRLEDVDRDGDLDTLVPHFLLDHLNVYMNEGNGQFALKEVDGLSAPPGSYFRSLLAGDFTGDGAPDYLTYQINSSTYEFMQMYLIKNNGHGSDYTVVGPAADPGVEFVVGRGVLSYVIEDADGDGDIDVLMRTQDDVPRQSKVFMNEGGGTFTLTQTMGIKVLALADVDQDGDKDMIGHEGNHLAVALQDSGTFGNPFDPFGPASPISGIQFVDASDFNDDGYPDFAFPDANQGATLFFNTTAQTGSVSFERSDALDDISLVENIWNEVNAQDVNDDGWTDIIVGLTRSNVADIFIRKPNTHGTLSRDDYFDPYPHVTGWVSTRDMDGDGLADLYGREVIRNRTYTRQQGYREQYGTGDPAMGDISPTMGASGPFRVGHSAALKVTGLTGGTIGLLSVGLQRSDLPNMPTSGLTSYNWPWLFFMLGSVAGPLGEPGAGHWTLPYVVMPEVAQLSVYHQFIALDPQYGLCSTNGLWLHYGD